MPSAPAPTVSSPYITYRQTQCISGRVGQTCGNPFLTGGNIVCYEIYQFESGVWVGLTFFEDEELHGGRGSMKVSGKSDLGAYVSFSRNSLRGITHSIAHPVFCSEANKPT